MLNLKIITIYMCHLILSRQKQDNCNIYVPSHTRKIKQDNYNIYVLLIKTVTKKIPGLFGVEGKQS